MNLFGSLCMSNASMKKDLRNVEVTARDDGTTRREGVDVQSIRRLESGIVVPSSADVWLV
jgi:hypothetical protein